MANVKCDHIDNQGKSSVIINNSTSGTCTSCGSFISGAEFEEIKNKRENKMADKKTLENISKKESDKDTNDIIQIRIFTNYSPEMLEKDVNKFLKTKKASSINNIDYDHTIIDGNTRVEFFGTVSVTYKESINN